MGKPKAPPPPDYLGLAKQQGQDSKDVAIYNSNVNRVNQFTPEGSSTWTLRPGADLKNPQPGDYIQTTTLSPEQRRLYDLNNQISQGFLGAGIQGLDRVSGVMNTPFSTNGLPALRNAPGVQQNAQAGTPVSAISGYRALPGQVDDPSRRRVEEAMLSRLEPAFQRDEEGLKTRLLNSGIEMGSEGWRREMGRLDQAKNDARMQAVLGGGQEESRQVGLNQGLQGQDFSQKLAGGQFANQAQGQEFSQQQAIDQLLNAFGIQSAGFDNQARQQGIQEQSYLRQLPINEINALRTGSQMQGPQFGSYYTGGSAQAAPILDAGIARGNYDMNAYQGQQAGYNALLGGLANFGGAYLGMPPKKP